jgi:hypothetical protein
MAHFCEHGNGTVGHIKVKEFSYHLNNYQL